MRARPKIFSKADLRAALTPRRASDHKGVFGHALIIAGSRGMAGAALLSAKAALRSGVGLVTLALPRGLQDALSGHIPEAMTLGLAQNSRGRLAQGAADEIARASAAKKFTVMAAGPGLSSDEETGEFLFEVLRRVRIPAVIDADALNFLARLDARAARRLLARPGGCVATPHPGEMARCLKTDVAAVEGDRAFAALSLARAWGCVALLKGPETLVSDGRGAWASRAGGHALAKGGSGDVLTGLLAGLWAQRLASGRGSGDPAVSSALLAAWLHGKAGEASAARMTARASAASSVIEEFPTAFRTLSP